MARPFAYTLVRKVIAMRRTIVGTSRSAKDGSIKAHVISAKSVDSKSVAGSCLSTKDKTSKATCGSCLAADPSRERRLHALKNLEGMWANKDTSFFDKKHA